MFENKVIINTIRFILLVFFQVLVCNQIDLFGSINPFIYIIFIFWYPIKENRMLFIFIAFLLGLTIDVFSNSGGAHATATVTIAYIRPSILKLAFGRSYELATNKIASATIIQRFFFYGILILTHHLILFSLEIFSFENILTIITKAVFSSLLTLFICLLIVGLFSREK